ncbi:MAG: hypothetical protein M0P13_04635 [Fibrobacteraceae bacterium]|nr:hypothetical protein [Fibrobacteraceae bacterium]
MMKKKSLLVFFILSFCTSLFAMMNEYGVISSNLEVELSGYGVFYRNYYSNGHKSSLSDSAEDSQLNLMPTIRVRPVRGLEFNFSYPIRDDGLKNSTGFWGPILGFKYGSPSSAGFFNLVFPAGAKNLLGNGESPEPALIFGGTKFFGGESKFGIRIHSWYFWDFNEHSADELYFLVRPEFNFGQIRVGVGFPFELYLANSTSWIDNTPGHVRALGGSDDDDEFGYAMNISIEPKVTIDLGALSVEPYFSFPLWRYTNKSALLYTGYTLGVAARFDFDF